MKINRLNIAFFAVGMAIAAHAVAADKQPSPRVAQVLPKPVSTAPAAQKDGNAEKALAQAAQNAGLLTCKPLAEQVNRYLIANSISTGMLFAAPEKANTRIFSSSIEIQSKEILTYSSANFSPNGDVGCGVSYDAVTYWKDSCADVASKELKTLKPLGPLGNQISMLDGGPTMRIFLMPAGTGCVQIKKEIIY